MKANKFVAGLILVLFIMLQFNSIVFASVSGSSEKENTLITVNVKNADIRDILSALAVKMECNIIYTDEPVRMDFSVQNVTCKDALNILLKSVGKEYLEDKNTIIAGSREVLENNYLDKIAITSFTLKYIRSDILSSLIDTLSIPVRKVTLSTNDKVIFVQGLPGDLPKVAQLISLIDRPENAHASDDYNLYSVTLSHITAEQLNSVLNEIGFYSGLVMESNPMTLWVYGIEEDISMVNEIKSQLDVPQNAIANTFILKRKQLRFLTSDKAETILTELNIDVNVLSLNRRMHTVWLNGTEDAVNLALSVLEQLDIQDYMEHDHITVYKLRNITAKEAMARLRHIENQSNIKFYTFAFPQFVKNVMVFCPQDYRLFVLNQLEEIDVPTDEIKVPVDYSSVAGGKIKLKNRRSLICELTGLPEEKFTISDNVSRDDSYLFIMYLEASPDIVQYVKDVIKMIDDPLADGSY